MTGFGAPCGACKFLRRKCARDCVFAPYFSHDQGGTHFAAIHKVFGASNVSKLLMHLPVPDRSEAAVTISYEAQARLEDPIYGCVAHIFALQQQVVNLQAQLLSLEAQPTLGLGNVSSTRQNLFPNGNAMGMADQLFTTANSNSQTNVEAMPYFRNRVLETNGIQSSQSFNSSTSMTGEAVQIGMDGETSARSAYRDLEDLQSVAYAFLHRQ